jgi:hypothetical protein
MAQPQPPTPASQDDPAAWEASQKAYLDWNKAQKGWTVSATGVQAHRASAAAEISDHREAAERRSVTWDCPGFFRRKRRPIS